MSDELNQELEELSSESENTDNQEQFREEDFNTGDNIPTAPPQDSLAINRAKAAYGKKTSNTGLRERRTPQRVVTSDYVNEEEYEPDDIDDDTLIAPEKGIINKTYQTSVELKEQKTFTPIAESNGGTDVLALQSSDSKAGQTISFKVKGIQWKSGFSHDFNKTPLGHAMHPIPLPAPTDDRPDALKKTGIVIRPVNPKLQKVLNQLLPGTYKKEMVKDRGKKERLKQLSIFYLPSTQSSSVGFIHEFVVPRSDGKDAFYLYIQTSVGKAPVAILDEVLRTLEAGLPEGEKADIFDYTQNEEQDVVLPEPDYRIAEEVNQAMKQVSSTFNDSIFVHSARQGISTFRNSSVDFMRKFDKYLARFIRVLAAIVLIFMNSWPIKIFVSGLRIFTKGVVQAIWGLNKLMLRVSRSPVTAKILGGIGKFLSLIGGLLGAVASGLGYFFRMIGRAFAVAYSSTSSLFKNPIKLDLGSLSPRKISFDLGEKDDKKKKSSLKIKGAKKASIAKPTLKNKNQNVQVGATGNFKQITRPTAKKPPPPKVKGATGNFAQIPGASGGGIGNRAGSNSNEPVGANNSNSKTPGNSPLGYFEDEPF